MINKISGCNLALLKRFVYIALLFLFFGSTYAGNPDKEKTATKVVGGHITDTLGESIPGAKIIIPETGETFFADLDGNFKLSLKTDKDYSVTIHTIGYEPLVLKASRLTAFSEVSLTSL